MILDFTTHFPWNKKAETMFREKIIKGLMLGSKTPEIYIPYSKDMHWLGALLITQQEMQPKIHTIRKDTENRWKPGVYIDFFINAGTKKAHLFAPKKTTVKSLQQITIKWTVKSPVIKVLDSAIDKVCTVYVDNKFIGDAYFCEGKVFSCTKELTDLATNDGFNTMDEFFQWFKEDFSGKIIHWTTLKY